MELQPLRCLAVSGAPQAGSATRAVLLDIATRLRAGGCEVTVADLAEHPLPLFHPEHFARSPAYAALQPRVAAADVFVLATPDYHGCMSGGLKNFLDHFWKEYAGRLFVPVVASYDKGLTVMDEIRTVARQCYAWCLPYGVTVVDREDVRDGQVVGEALRQRLTMLVRDVRVYGALLAAQRRADLAGADAGYMARYRPQPSG